MSILSTIKKGYLSVKTATGYLKLLPHTLSTLVTMNDGTTVEDKISQINTNLSNIDDLIYSTGYIAQPYQIKVPKGESLLLITSDSSLWYIVSMSSGIYIKQIVGDSTSYLITSNIDTRTVTVKGKSSGDIAISYIRFKPRYI